LKILLHPNYLAIVLYLPFYCCEWRWPKGNFIAEVHQVPPFDDNLDLSRWKGWWYGALQQPLHITKEKTSPNSWSSHTDDNVQSTIVTTRLGTMWKREMLFLCLVLAFMLCVYVCLVAHVCCLCFVLHFFLMLHLVFCNSITTLVVIELLQRVQC
jgi:hypothetical protein